MLLKDLLKELRESRGLNKQELANKVDISRSYISTIESGKVEKPTKKTLTKIAYVFDPDGNDGIYKKLLESAGYDSRDSMKEFKKYVSDVNYEYIKGNYLSAETMSKMSYRVNKNDDSFVFLDYPYMNIEWLINQDSFYIYCGLLENDFTIDAMNSEVHPSPLVIKDEELKKLRNLIKEFKKDVLENRANQQKEKDEEEISKENMEYQLIFDLIQNKIENDIQLIHRL
ncbi:XRE family transcriptional regulator, partial [Staphylococcus xylosus]|uniref:helix-turn-helix transcriptional regulator n=2 Tax=Staphylococcus TaxID=1279 RepID=UPI000ED77342